jgi:hypothetical protein
MTARNNWSKSMDQSEARDLIETYVEGWKCKDMPAILGTLASKCVIVESHGPTYRGIPAAARWVEDWFKEGNTIEKWSITSFYFTNEAAFFEWHFACTAGNQHYEFDGASIARFVSGKIASLREYRMTENPYDWIPKD